MKRLLMTMFVGLAMCLTAETQITLKELSNEQLLDFFNGELAGTIIEIPENTRASFDIKVEGDLLALKSQPCELTVLKTIYVSLDADHELCFSTDLQHWEPMSNFATGVCSATMQMESGEPIMRVGIEMNERHVMHAAEKD